MDLKHEVTPLDLAILPLLPVEGSMLGKYHPMGRRVKDIVTELDDSYTTVHKVQSRCRVMTLNGLVVSLKGGADRIWQRTSKGSELLREHGLLDEVSDRRNEVA